mmetsp:Transcript_92653/g.135417  ORF Transcript_92653/g.135417 Transcript_92653/m.135417 type:complete len:367 (+) Transcript_92653:151-1251(+)
MCSWRRASNSSPVMPCAHCSSPPVRAHTREEVEEEEEGEETEGFSPARGEHLANTPSRMAFTPGGRQHAALSPIAQEEDDEEEEEETEGGRRSHRTSTAMAEQEDEEEDAPARGYLQPPVTSTPGKEYHVRKTALGGTPLRLAVAPSGDEDDSMSSPQDSEGSFITRVAVRATSAQKEEHGSNVILTPVRRSARKQRQWNTDDCSSVGEQLAGCGYAYQPNKNILYPEDDHDEDNDHDDVNADKPDETTNPSDKTPADTIVGQHTAAAEGKEEEEKGEEEEEKGLERLGESGVQRPVDLNLKRKATASPSPRKSSARTPRGSAKKLPLPASAPSSAQDEVNMKRQMLRAKLAEADSPLPPPSRILP